MGCFGVGNFGIRRLIDANQSFFNPSTPVYYRVQNFDLDNTDIGQMGFQVVNPVTGMQTGTIDTLVCPTPTITRMSLRELEAAINSGSALRAGAVRIFISATWVNAIMAANEYINPSQVFTDRSVVGFVNNN